MLRLYTSFDGRIGRGTFWWALIQLLLVETAFNMALNRLTGNDTPFLDGTPARLYLDSSWASLRALMIDATGWITAVVFLWPNLAINIKRLHDRGYSGWATLIFLVPFLAAYAFTATSAGVPRDPASLWHLASAFPSLWYLITVGFLPGTPGPNRFGPPPGAAIAQRT